MTIEGGLSGFPVVWHEDCLLHDPGGEVWLGQRDEGTEVPDRARVILAALTAAGARVGAGAPPGPAARRAGGAPAPTARP
jgi:hypothetical protein